MKKILAYAAPLAMALAGSVAVPTAVQAESAKDLNALCKAAVAAGFIATQGDCMRLPSAICEAVKDAGGFPLDLGGGVIRRNKGDCVNYVKGAV